MNETQFNALPLAQRKAIQQQLKDQGFYVGGIDGQFGAGTETAFKLRDEAKATAARQEREGNIAEIQASADAEKAKAEADRIRAEAEAERIRSAQRQQYNEQANSAEGVATKIAANTVAPLTGVAAGRAMGLGINQLADRSQGSRNQALQGAAQDRMEGRTTREGARVGTERSGAMPSRNSALRVGGRMLPHAITGAGMMGKGAAMLSDDSGEAFYADQANRAAGLGMIGAGTGLLERGAAYAVNPGVSPDARSIAIMESNQLRRSSPAAQAQASKLAQAMGGGTVDPPKAPRATSASPGSLAALRQQARELNVPGRSQMNKAQLADALAEKLRAEGSKRTVGKRAPKLPKGGLLWPLGAAALAYEMTPERASASQGGEAQVDQGEALTNAGIAGGITASGIKLADALSRVAPTTMRALGGSAPGMLPEMISSMTDYPQEDLNRGRNWMARNLPEALQVGAVSEAREMATVPEKNPARVYGNAYRPGGGKAPQVNFPPKLMSRLERMRSQGANDDQIASWLNRALP